MGFVQEAFKSSYGIEKPKFFWWYPEGTSAKEKKLLTKIDFFILTYCCFGYFAKWLDRKQIILLHVKPPADEPTEANLSNAYGKYQGQDEI